MNDAKPLSEWSHQFMVADNSLKKGITVTKQSLIEENKSVYIDELIT